MLDAKLLRSCLRYDGKTGAFFWLSGKTIGKRAGCNMRDGYRTVTIDRKMYYEHRLVWLYVTGAWPAKQIDHKDGDKANNRFENLREATAAENAQNRVAYRTNKAGLQGVALIRNKYVAQIKAGATHLRLGVFTSAEAAHAAYREAKRHLHAFQPEPRAM